MQASMSITEARSRVALLEAMRRCILSHQRILEKGILHCDISPGNIYWNGIIADFERSAFLGADGSSGVYNRGTKPFKAIGVLRGEENSFMHDLESFFWVLFWICIYREGTSIQNRIVLPFEKWWYMDKEELVRAKQEIVRDEDDFLKTATENFTIYHQPLIPWLNRLRKMVFPEGLTWDAPNKRLYDDMRETLEEAQADPIVSEE